MKKTSLSGVWSFSPSESFDGSADRFDVRVPGSWRSVPGLQDCEVGVYSRRFSLRCGEIKEYTVLRFGGVFRKAEVRLNGVDVGKHNGLQSPFAFDVSSIIREGENLLEVLVDSRRPDDELLGFCSVYELIPIDFAGIYEPVELLTYEKAAVTSLYTPVDLNRNKALLLFDTHSTLPNTATGKLLLRLSKDNNCIFEKEFQVVIAPDDGEIRIELPVELFDLWSPENPVLYDVEAALTESGTTDTFKCKTGFKSFEARGTDFYLNGRPYYVLGYGDDFVFPEGLPSGKTPEDYYFGIRRAKEYGFNFARHHSHFPFEAYLDAADALGLLIQPELALANIPRERFNEENSKLFILEWTALIKSYRRHPCIAVWCGGNEMEWGFPFSKQLYDIAKQLDPYRPAQSTDGLFTSHDVDDAFDFSSIVPAEYTDYLPIRELADMFTRDFSGKPQIIHEMGNFTTVFNIDDLPRLKKSSLGHARTKEIADLVKQKDIRPLYNTARNNALQMQKLCHKLNVEKARLSANFCGYHLWTLIDYYETTQGLLNAFYEDKALTAEEFSSINSQCVLLWDTNSYVFRSGKPAQIDVKLSKYGSDNELKGRLTVTLYDKTKEIARREEFCRFSGHGIFSVLNCTFDIPEDDAQKEYTLKAEFKGEGRGISNSWSLFAIPQVHIGSEKEIYIHYLSRYIFDKEDVPIRYYGIPQPIGAGQLIVTGSLFSGMLDNVKNGASMLLLAGADTFRQTVSNNSFKTPWWDPGRIWYLNHTNNIQVSSVIEEHAATKMIPYRGAWKLDLFGAVEQAYAVNADALGIDVEPLIYGVDTDFDRLLYLFQFSYGSGKILVCTLNHSKEDMKDPGVEYLIKSIINYAMSDAFSPKKQLSDEHLYSALNLI